MNTTNQQTEVSQSDADDIIKRACDDSDIDETVVSELTGKAERNLYDGASEEEVFEACIQVTSDKIEEDPAFKKVAARIFREKYFTEVVGEQLTGYDYDRAYRGNFMEYIPRGVEEDILDERMLSYDLADLADYLELGRDDRFDYMAMDTLYQRYFIKTETKGEHLELPQSFWMRIAMGIALREDEHMRQQRAKEYYDLLSTHRFIFSTPTLFHAGTTHPQLSSCYLTTVQDDLEDIFESYKKHAQLSKWSGGLGNDWTNLRAQGALIESTRVESTGTVPFLKISNDVTHAINRSGKRRGAACAYLAAWHYDFEDFLDLKRNTGDERRRTHDMNTAAWVPDLFMKRVRAGEEWTLFSPDEVPELHSLYGEEFEEKYREYEEKREEMRNYKVVDAESLWKTMLTRLFETGHPWITFKDPCNIRSPQDHDGVINSSNLCTEITLNTSQDETAVCNLGSVNMERHVSENGLKNEKLEETVQTAMRMLDNVIDLCFYPTDRAERSNMRHRPVGLGTMGVHAALLKQGIPMDSPEGIEFCQRAQEFVSKNAILGSSKLAKERGTYESYEGSKWDRGLFPQDTMELLEEERGREIPVSTRERFDWSDVREHVEEHGMRNSNTMAMAPTATISTIAGTTPSIEPIYSNLYVKSNMSGDFTVVNDYMVEALKERDQWDEETIDRIKYHDGSIQEIDYIDNDYKKLFKGAFEIDPRTQMEVAANRAVFIDQSQSFNVFFPSTDGTMLDEIYQTAWELGMKTTYYLRTLGASQIEKSTIDMEEYGRTQTRNLTTDGGETDEDGDGDACSLPSVDGPDCEACQ